MDEPVYEVEYRARWTSVAWSLLGGGPFAAWAWYQAVTHEGPMKLSRFDLSPTQATVFHYAAAVLFSCIVVFGLYGAFIRLTVRKRITVTADAIRVPRPFRSREQDVIAFVDVLEISEADVRGAKMCTIRHRGGRFTIEASMMSDDAHYDWLCNEVAARARHAHRQSG